MKPAIGKITYFARNLDYIYKCRHSFEHIDSFRYLCSSILLIEYD